MGSRFKKLLSFFGLSSSADDFGSTETDDDMPFEKYTEQDDLHFRRWLAKNGRKATGPNGNAGDGMFAAFLSLATSISNAADARPDLYPKMNDEALFEVGCHLFYSTMAYTVHKHPKVDKAVIPYISSRFLKLSAEALNVNPEVLKSVLVERIASYEQVTKDRKLSIDQLIGFTGQALARSANVSSKDQRINTLLGDHSPATGLLVYAWYEDTAGAWMQTLDNYFATLKARA